MDRRCHNRPTCEVNVCKLARTHAGYVGRGSSS
uniref:Uncharacterized protein n=1 Tax=Cucumis melo TaxID=3656 RepID=A0A9I9E3P4_CUCME